MCRMRSGGEGGGGQRADRKAKYWCRRTQTPAHSMHTAKNARTQIKKKRIGPARIQDNRSLFYRKDISLLARNGFDFETSKKVMELKKEDYLKIIRLL